MVTVIPNESIDTLISAYRVMTLYHYFIINDVDKLKRLVYTLNFKMVKKYCGLFWVEDMVFIDEEMLNILMLNITNNPVFKGRDDELWSPSSDWYKISVAHKSICQELVDDPSWLIDDYDTSYFDYLKYLSSDEEDAKIEASYINGQIENHFMFRGNYNEYKEELRNRKINLLI